MKILITDDSKLARLSLMKTLLDGGFGSKDESLQATNGQEALEQMQEHMPHLVFLDLTMPVMDGNEALPKLLELNSKAQIIVVSADIQPKAKEKVLELGAKMHVQKPISLEKMQEVFQKLRES